LIGNFQNQIVYEGDSLLYIENLSDFVFNMLYENYQYVDSVLYADSVAEAYAGNHNSSIYYNKFWEIAKNFTIGLFQKASHRLTCIIYTEWINSGVSYPDYSENNNLISGFTLLQNYPNPFNPSTKIKYAIPTVTLRKAQSDISVTLKVYDVLGNEIETLVNEEKTAGSYEVTWFAEKLPSGVYFYQLRVGELTQTKKMILTK
jgi:hypothetical protein